MKYLHKMLLFNLLSSIQVALFLFGSYFIVYTIHDEFSQLIIIIALLAIMMFLGVNFMPFKEPKEIKSLKELREWYDKYGEGAEYFDISIRELESLEAEAEKKEEK